MKRLFVADRERYKGMGTHELRRTFLVEGLFEKGKISLAHVDVDRAVVGSVVPVGEAIELGTDDELKAAYFLERRELGILNIGGKGMVMADGKTFVMEHRDCLYAGLGTKDVRFTSADSSKPAQFYLISYPAHATHSAVLVKKEEAAVVQAGKPESLNQRTISKYIHAEGVKSCQLVMGVTELAAGSNWNSMPPHTHIRRSEVYLYFNLPPDARVFHLMGLPEETRHMVVADKQAAISPSWSIHAGSGTANYAYCWAMGGENQAFDDMDTVAVAALK